MIILKDNSSRSQEHGLFLEKMLLFFIHLLFILFFYFNKSSYILNINDPLLNIITKNLEMEYSLENKSFLFFIYYLNLCFIPIYFFKSKNKIFFYGISLLIVLIFSLLNKFLFPIYILTAIPFLFKKINLKYNYSIPLLGLAVGIVTLNLFIISDNDLKYPTLDYMITNNIICQHKTVLGETLIPYLNTSSNSNKKCLIIDFSKMGQPGLYLPVSSSQVLYAK